MRLKQYASGAEGVERQDFAQSKEWLLRNTVTHFFCLASEEILATKSFKTRDITFHCEVYL